MSKVRNAPTAPGPASGRALTARSVVLSVLLGTEPPRLPTALLVRTTALFGISEGTTRTALSRLVAAGELRATGGSHELSSPPLLARQARQTASREGRVGPWDGSWVQAVVGSGGARSADERAMLRATLASARFAELREGVWMRPDNLGRRPGVGSADVVWCRAEPEGPDALASRLWDLAAWATTARSATDELERLAAPLARGDRAALAPGFVLSAATLRHFQADPLLPAALLPDGWPGAELRDAYDRFDRAYRDVLRSWFDEQRS